MCMKWGILLVASAAALAGPVQWSSGIGANGHYYQAFLAPGYIGWQQSETSAEALGGYLATITSSAEDLFAYALIDYAEFWHIDEHGNSIGPWLGGLDAAGNNVWSWVTGETWNYTNWAPGDPNNIGTETRLEYFAVGATRAMNWNNLSPDPWPLGYIVEWDSAPVPEPAQTAPLLLAVAALAFRRRRSA